MLRARFRTLDIRSGDLGTRRAIPDFGLPDFGLEGWRCSYEAVPDLGLPDLGLGTWDLGTGTRTSRRSHLAHGAAVGLGVWDLDIGLAQEARSAIPDFVIWDSDRH